MITYIYLGDFAQRITKFTRCPDLGEILVSLTHVTIQVLSHENITMNQMCESKQFLTQKS